MTVLADAPAPPAPPPAPVAPHVRERASGRGVGWWGVVALIATEAMVFALLLFANFYLRAEAKAWPLGGIKPPELFKASIRSVILIGSSLPIHLGERAIKRGNRRGLLWGIGIAWVMGLVFLIGHFAEYDTLWREFTPSTNAYGSAFYTITGLHALHLMVGLVVLAYLWYRGLRGHYDEHHHEPVECGVLYWHFVDAVWIFVFASLYLSVGR